MAWNMLPRRLTASALDDGINPGVVSVSYQRKFRNLGYILVQSPVYGLDFTVHRDDGARIYPKCDMVCSLIESRLRGHVIGGLGERCENSAPSRYWHTFGWKSTRSLDLWAILKDTKSRELL